ncbi:expressed protein [Chlorella variabilis]|uniref:Expressed protein n=1 Tax=Chlorella variabilis TaxID=554065 RepID=E1ZG67_CHLVA|nr:expressed protein [Chlorella variabilis]EFN55413.1 expressed protein [Chlorella variabilis]|eukprot:XP_005847515.1 expressed protein [Chlorella variabilis]
MSLPLEERSDAWPTRVGTAVGVGFAAGALFGAVASNWGDIPVVLRDKPWPALVRTGVQMAQHGSTLALVGGTFAAVDVSPQRPCLSAGPVARRRVHRLLLRMCAGWTGSEPAPDVLGGRLRCLDMHCPCFAESARGKKDWVNGSLAGGAAGLALGLRIGSLPAAVKSAAALAFVSAMVDLSGGRLVGTGFVDDGATPPRRIYPYNS